MLQLEAITQDLQRPIFAKIRLEAFIKLYLFSNTVKELVDLLGLRNTFFVEDVYIYFNDNSEISSEVEKLIVVVFDESVTITHLPATKIRQIMEKIPFRIVVRRFTVEKSTTAGNDALAESFRTSRSRCSQLTVNTLDCSPNSMNNLIEAASVSKLCITDPIPYEFFFQLNTANLEHVELCGNLDDFQLLHIRSPSITLTETVVTNLGISLLLKEWFLGIRTIDELHIHSTRHLDARALEFIPKRLISTKNQEKTYEIEKPGLKKFLKFYRIDFVYISDHE